MTLRLRWLSCLSGYWIAPYVREVLSEGKPARFCLIDDCGAADGFGLLLDDWFCGNDGSEVKFLSPDTGGSHSESTVRVGNALWHFLVILCHSPKWTRSGGNF